MTKTTSPASPPAAAPSRRRRLLLPALIAAVILGGIGLALTQPWRLFIDTTVAEALPQDATVIAAGALVSHEHPTSGAASIVRTADGSAVLRLEDLETDSGPDLRVWITDADISADPADWQVFSAAEHVDLGELKGNKGSQNYPIPAGVDIAGIRSVTIWCDRFSVSFGAAALGGA